MDIRKSEFVTKTQFLFFLFSSILYVLEKSVNVKIGKRRHLFNFFLMQSLKRDGFFKIWG